MLAAPNKNVCTVWMMHVQATEDVESQQTSTLHMRRHVALMPDQVRAVCGKLNSSFVLQ